MDGTACLMFLLILLSFCSGPSFKYVNFFFFNFFNYFVWCSFFSLAQWLRYYSVLLENFLLMGPSGVLGAAPFL